jgi:C1A family cysteine protease
LEQFLGVAQAAGPELAAYLGISVGKLSEAVNNSVAFGNAIPKSALDIIHRATYALGVAIDHVSAPNLAPSVTYPAPPSASAANLTPHLPPIQKNQGPRGTCVAYAALAAYEHYLNLQGAYQDLSEQFLYWNCKRHDDFPNEGTWLAIAMPLLHREGVCLEATWPYADHVIPGNEGHHPPPGGAQLEALTFRIPGYKQLSPTCVDDLKNELAHDRCVAFSVPVFNSWLRSGFVANGGDITMPVPGEMRVGGHAMCLVGYVDSPNPGLGGGRFILRNSWGTDWGINSRYGPGYGTIPYAYIARMGAEAYSIV